MMLLPPKPTACPICAVDPCHGPNEPHNQQSLYYQYRFMQAHGRWPTWADAVAHCHPEVRAMWERELRKLGKWSEPEDGEPIADPLAESVHQAVGDVNSPTFVPESDDDTD